MIDVFPTLTLEPILTVSSQSHDLADTSELARKLSIERLKNNHLQACEAYIYASHAWR